jgi:Rrf2 family iron-sulfur cluster assembly transcriptional regulator
MDVALSRKADYAVRAMIALGEAWESGGLRTISAISEEMALPRSYTPQVLGRLIEAGLVVSRPGRGGGYRLTRDPADIRMLAIVEAADGPLRIERCTLRGGPCRWEDRCAVHDTWVDAVDALRRSLEEARLTDVLARDLPGRSYPVRR